ncbi:DUF4238 domain-containing protein [Klebsiella pasteurii]|uniref:DUF4238 domain-containing protein n=1 Tax=Klebsiella pasteurii TaxID=2587529 RepID=UPI0039930DAD
MKENLIKLFKKEQRKIKHHFVPQFYIKRFYDNEINEVWRGDKKYKTIKKFTSAQIFYAPKLYDLKIYKHEFTKFEDMYSQLEFRIDKLYKELDKNKSIEILRSNSELNKSFFAALKTIVALQYFRTYDIVPSLLEIYCSNIVEIYNTKSESFKKTFNCKLEELKEYEKIITRGIRKEKKYTKEMIKGLQHSILPMLLSDFTKGKLQLKKSNKRKYITSDKPVACKSIEDIIQFKNFMYPLSPDIIVYSLGEDVTEELMEDDNKINEYLFNNAISYIISHDKNIISQYIK